MTELESLTTLLASVYHRRDVDHIISALWWCTRLITDRWIRHSSFPLLTSWLKMFKGLCTGGGASICVLVFVFSTFIHSPDLFPLSINKWTGSMWWISLLTLYQLQVNNYYSCFIVAGSIPGCRHLPRDRRLDWELLFCIWSDVIHFIISCNKAPDILREFFRLSWTSGDQFPGIRWIRSVL